MSYINILPQNPEPPQPFLICGILRICDLRTQSFSLICGFAAPIFCRLKISANHKKHGFFLTNIFLKTLGFKFVLFKNSPDEPAAEFFLVLPWNGGQHLYDKRKNGGDWRDQSLQRDGIIKKEINCFMAWGRSAEIPLTREIILQRKRKEMIIKYLFFNFENLYLTSF